MVSHNTTPAALTPEILAFCRELDSGRVPTWVAVRAAAAESRGQDFANLKAHVTRQGGRIQVGWIIWEHPGWFLEAQFHGVWVSPEGELIDVYPANPESARILFQPDSRRTFQGESIPNRFQALSRSADVLAVVQSAEYHAQLRAEAETLSRRASVAPGNTGRNHPCPCGSGLKYKKCCGRGVPGMASPT